MLEAIKSIINAKREYSESASFLYEGVMSDNLDDLIIINEASDTEVKAICRKLKELNKEFSEILKKNLKEDVKAYNKEAIFFKRIQFPITAVNFYKGNNSCILLLEENIRDNFDEITSGSGTCISSIRLNVCLKVDDGGSKHNDISFTLYEKSLRRTIDSFANKLEGDGPIKLKVLTNPSDISNVKNLTGWEATGNDNESMNEYVMVQVYANYNINIKRDALKVSSLNESAEDDTELDDMSINGMDDDIRPDIDSTEPESSDDGYDVMSAILSTSIDLKSNTFNDVLPVPPENAAEVVPDDENNDSIMNTRIDSGFGGDETEKEPEQEDPIDDVEDMPADEDDDIEDIMNTDISKESEKDDNNKDSDDDVKEESADYDLMNSNINEAISLDGDDEKAPAEGSDEAPDVNLKGDDSVVADTIKDKTSEMEEPAEEEIPEEDSSEDSSSNEGPIDKEKIMKNLAGLTKNIEDIKMSIVKS